MQITSAALPRLAKLIGDYAKTRVDELKKQGNAEEAAKWEEGGVYRVATHAALGALGGGLGGAVGAAAAEAAPTLDKLQDALQNKLATAGLSSDAANVAAKLIAGGTAAAVGGAAGGSAGAVTGLNTDANNRQLHPDEEKWLRKMQEGKSPEEQQRLADAACALVHCSAGLADGPAKAILQEQEKRGQLDIIEQSLLEKTGQFKYTWADKGGDFVSWTAEGLKNELKSAGRGAVNLGYQILTHGPSASPQSPPDLPDDFGGPRPSGGTVMAGVPIAVCVPPFCALVVAPVITPGKPSYVPSNVYLSDGGGGSADGTSNAASGTAPSAGAKGSSASAAGAEATYLPKGARPDPATYLSRDQIDAHLANFDQGGSYLVPKDVLDKYGRDLLGYPDNSQFLMTKPGMDRLLAQANGDVSVIEKELGIPVDAWKGKELVRIDVPNPRSLDFRMPSGNEMGANDLWLSGGKLPNGQLEAVVNSIPNGKYIERSIWVPKK